MGIYVDNWKIPWIFVDLCGYLWIFVDIASSLIYMLVGLCMASLNRIELFLNVDTTNMRLYDGSTK
jgi:hypothetical protein